MKNLRKKSSGIYEARIRFDPSERIVYRSLRTRNHAIALKRLDAFYNRLELEREGMLTPKRITESRNTEIKTLLVSYLTDLEMTATSQDYINRMEQRIKKLSRECGWKVLKNIDSLSFIQWRGKQKLTPKTLNDYLSMMNCFLSWLIDNSFAEGNPLEKVKRVPVRGRHKFRRRAFKPEEIKALLTVAPDDRKLVYVMALTTGLRRRELESLKPSDIHLDTNNPYLVVRADKTKNGKAATLYLHPDAIDQLTRLNIEGKKVLNVPDIDDFKSDLKKAGIEYHNDQNERADFHSLRHTFCTRLAKSGVSPQVAQKLMRHTDISLTTNVYTDSGQLDITAVRKLPSLFGEKKPQLPPQNAPKTPQIENFAIFLEMAKALGIEGDTLMKIGEKMVEMGGIEPPSE